MITFAGDLGVWLDSGTNKPGVPLERFEAGERIPYLIDGAPGRWPMKLNSLSLGRYRARE